MTHIPHRNEDEDEDEDDDRDVIVLPLIDNPYWLGHFPPAPPSAVRTPRD